MFRLIKKLVVAIILSSVVPCSVAQAQTPTDSMANAYFYANGGYGQPYYGYHASTAAEGYLRGEADLVRSTGQYNLLTAMAATQHEQAVNQRLENRKKRTETYYALRSEHDRYMSAKRRKPPSAEDIERWNAARRPARLTRSQFEPELGIIHWPKSLMQDQYEECRTRLEELYHERLTGESGLGSENHREVLKYTAEMQAKLKKQVKTLGGNEFIRAKKFVDSLAFEARFSVDAESIAAN